MNKEMFREYDLRGIVPTDINEEVSYTIGMAFASYIKNKKVIIGHDNRLSSDNISDNLVKGLLKCGAHIIDLGLCTTPMYYAMKKYLNIENGIMITASHNPKEYNGFKISFDMIGNAYGKMIEDFRDFTFAGNFTYKEGSYEKISCEKYYLDLIKNSISLGNRKIKVVFDTGNGTGSVIVKKVLDLFPEIEYKLINEVSDGNFPNHHPDPCVKENMIELGNTVKSLGYDFGVGIDGDADRAGFVDENGKLVEIDKIMIVFYKYLHQNFKDKKAIMDVKCSKALIDEMKRLNLPLEIYRTGSSYMNSKINLDKYDFGGEFSGHLWFLDKWPGFDDGIYAGLRMVELMSKKNISIAKEVEKMPKYYSTPEIKIPVEESKKEYIIDEVKKHLDNKEIKYNDIDGVRVDFPDGFMLIRKSNTGPNLTVRFEKQNEEELKKIKNKYLDLIDKIKG